LKVIDGYTHFIPKGYVRGVEQVAGWINNQNSREELLTYLGTIKERPHFIDLVARISELDKYKIDNEITVIDTSVDPNLIQLDSDRKLDLCRLLNDEMARVNSDSKGRIFAFGGIDVASTGSSQTEGLALGEMRRAVGDLGLRGFVVPSNVGGKPLDAFPSFWSEVERLNAAVYIHPTDPVSKSSRPYEDEFDLAHTFGWPFETTLALARLVFSGTLARHPRLRILGHHQGGMIPYYAGRIDETYSKRNASPRRAQWTTNMGGQSAIESFKLFYYDTAVGGSSATIRVALDVFGADRVVFATDYPFGPDSGRTRLATYPGKVRELGLSQQENSKIFEENAFKLLGI
jgi:aminocarboxymuconate-semialdehyde decarboxylase